MAPRSFETVDLTDDELQTEIFSQVFTPAARPFVICSARHKGTALLHHRGYFHLLDSPVSLPLSTRHTDVFLYLDNWGAERIKDTTYIRFLTRLQAGTYLRILCDFADSHHILRNLLTDVWDQTHVRENGNICFISAVKGALTPFR